MFFYWIPEPLVPGVPTKTRLESRIYHKKVDTTFHLQAAHKAFPPGVLNILSGSDDLGSVRVVTVGVCELVRILLLMRHKKVLNILSGSNDLVVCAAPLVGVLPCCFDSVSCAHRGTAEGLR